MTTLKNILEKGEEAFDEIFADYFVIKTGLLEDHKGSIKSFLASQTELAYKAGMQEAVEMCEEEKKVCGGDLQMNDEYEQCHGFNSALSAITKKLKNLIQ